MRDTRLNPSLSHLFPEPVRTAIAPIEPLLQKLLQLDRIGDLWEFATQSAEPSEMFDALLRRLDVKYRLEPGDLERVPASGPLVAVSNHPFGMLEGVILGSVLGRVRPDFKIMANSLVPAPPPLRNKLILVNPYGGLDARRENRRPLRDAVEWLRGGGLLIVFPAGDVAQLAWRERAVTDPPWNESVGKLIRMCGSAALPVYLAGSNDLAFHLAGVIHPRLRTADMPRQLLNKRGKEISVSLGRPVPARTLQSLPSHRDAIEYLRWRTHLLGMRTREAHLSNRLPQAPVVLSAPENVLAEEVDRLPGRPLAEADSLAVYLAQARQIPNVLREIGRLREITFRQAGEGTGGALDLDPFDNHYLHLFIWNRVKREVVGAYRLGPTHDIMPAHGLEGLYSSTLFRYDPELFRRIGPAIELGRSFVRVEYQRHFHPLLLLWKGICQYVLSRVSCCVLFGAVSISDDYTAASRDLLVRFLESQQDRDLARLVKSRRPYRAGRIGGRQMDTASRLLKDIEELSDPIADVEPDGKGVPILIKQYMRVGGRILGFNLDPSFHTLDALVLVDLRSTPPAILARYMSKTGADEFLRQNSKPRFIDL
jgi:putative hemolysin